jgi:MSHA biogenesis protein MshK
MNVRRLLVAAVVLTALVPAIAAARDPMRPPQHSAARSESRAESPVLLSAVMGAGDRRIAIVNGRVLRAGESFEGITVERVDATGIVYRRGGVQRELKLASAPAVKRPAAVAVARMNGVKEPAAASRGPAGEQ